MGKIELLEEMRAYFEQKMNNHRLLAHQAEERLNTIESLIKDTAGSDDNSQSLQHPRNFSDKQ